MGGEDWLDVEVFEDLAEFPGGEAAVLQLADRLGDGFAHGLGVLGADALADGVDAGVLLGQVVQVEIDGEGADQLAQRGNIERVEELAQEAGILGGAVVSQGNGGFADPIEPGQDLRAGQTLDGLPEEVLQHANILILPLEGLLGGRGIGRVHGW